ncbi:receptor-like serine/threonine-protein kinase ALE2 isoform X3 [Solanum pennellii]|uniref:Receptor-like serine/threonine-protein kinase ALE2 isoform X3 n=1 Tax=Solanum pennellii TaxID=28526 RepID=A0ABM1HNS4_SOLPN|nr:receptor-like serine/threonine-protein kinase ALE2 isoform X3 [Solanum pennellii]
MPTLMLLFLLSLLTLLTTTTLGITLPHIYLSPTLPPNKPYFASKLFLGDARLVSTHVSFAPISAPHRHHFKPHMIPSRAPAPSPASQGLAAAPIASRVVGHHRHRHNRPRARVSPSPAVGSGCGEVCAEPFASVPFVTPCTCVFPMKVRLLLDKSLYSIFPVVRDLGIEVAKGTYLRPSQVVVVGASADNQNQERTIVDINLVPLEDKFDNTTAMLIYERFWKKKMPLNRTMFGDYDVMHIMYPVIPGLPSSPPSGIGSGNGPTGSAVDQQFPITADFGNKSQKMNPRVIFLIASSALVLLVVCCGALVVLLNCRRTSRPSNAVGPVFTSSMHKRSGKGIGSTISSSTASSTSVSLISAMPASILSVKTFTLAELEKATDKFSLKRVLGEGGFGRVYHGILEDRTEVAVKVLTRDNNQNGDREFIAEVEMLSRLHHRNLVKLIGICSEERTRSLIYEIVRNGSVESHLHGKDRIKGPLDWDVRLKIALGAARGLAYLHEDSNPRVIHRDFKASNVLLEEDFTPKVSDFGLAREATEGSDHVSTRVMGTFGYVAPEYAMTGHLLVKSDVYSYGVVLLELLSGRKPVDMSQPPGQENLVTWARPLLTTREGLEQLVDPSLAGTYDFDDMAKVAAIASMCVHPEVTQRPFMGEVVQALKLIYNDNDETCADGCSQKESSLPDSDFKGVPSDSSWWNAGGLTPRLTYGQASNFMTMDYSSGPLEEFENRPFSASSFNLGGEAGLLSHGNRSGPLRTVRSKPALYRLRGSMSEHGALLPRHAWKDGTNYDASF